jgi:DNA-binding beta-propeller fold protein YncE
VGSTGTPAVQETTRHRRPWRVPARRRVVKERASALPATTSRFIENRTTHAADFRNANSDQVYLAKIAAVEGKDVTGSATIAFAYVPGIVGGNVTIFNISTRTLVSAITGTTNPYGVAATPDGAQVWVTESGTNTVSVVAAGAQKGLGGAHVQPLGCIPGRVLSRSNALRATAATSAPPR